MKYSFLIFTLTLVILLTWGETWAQGWPCPGIKPGGQIGFNQQTAADDNAVALTLPAGVTFRPVLVAIINVSGANSLRFRSDGTAPTSAIGHLLNQNDQLIVCGSSVGNMQLINDTPGSNFIIEVHFYGGN